MKIDIALDIIGTWKCEKGYVRHKARVHNNAFALPRKFTHEGRTNTLTQIEIKQGDTVLHTIYLDQTNGTNILDNIQFVE